MKRLTGWFLRWLTGWADIVDGVCWVCTLGAWRPEASLHAENAWLNWVESRAANDRGLASERSGDSQQRIVGNSGGGQ